MDNLPEADLRGAWPSVVQFPNCRDPLEAGKHAELCRQGFAWRNSTNDGSLDIGDNQESA